MDYNAIKKSLREPIVLERPPLKECYVAYIDILGYKQFFDNHPDKIDLLLDAISNGYQNILRGLNFVNHFYYNIDKIIELRCFSDNLLVYCEAPESNNFKPTLLVLMEVVKEIQRILLLNYGLMIRGAITKGKFAANNFFVFGHALIEAVVNEESYAKYPRVILTKAVVVDVNSSFNLDDTNAQRVYDNLVKTFSLFESSSTHKLAKRCLNAYKTFNEIVREVPFVIPIENMEALRGLEQNHTEMANLVKRNNNNNKVLERVFKQIVQQKDDMFTIYHQLVDTRKKQFREYINAMATTSLYEDEDGFYSLDYLGLADYTNIIHPKMLHEMLSKFHHELSEFPSIVENTTAYLDKNKLSEIRNKMLTLHQKVIVYILKSDESDYLRYVDGSFDNYNEGVIKKHIWAMKYHNSHCEKHGFVDLTVSCTTSVGKNQVLYVENIKGLDEVQVHG